ncbi:MAG: type 4a pilus biogenesis protein PilO [Halieaceae bacterium]|jgi:type IV pilus assembly protein PilO|nr:type 4a pilus biogenesis protein PilO [Halieaceae bacterium]
MAMEDILKSVQEFDINDLDLDNIGAWPLAIKVIVWVLALVGVLALGYFYHIQNLQTTLVAAQNKEVELREEFERKAFQAANLEAYRKQMQEMEESFGALVSQLPSDTEVPGLLEDITNKGMMNGLEFSSIELQAEVAREFYIELPIQIVARGSYHDLGAFVSGMASLPRIVTLHDFVIRQQDPNSAILSLNITARTYRYRDEEV